MCAVGPGRRTYIELMGEPPAGNLRQHHSIVEGAVKSISAGSCETIVDNESACADEARAGLQRIAATLDQVDCCGPMRKSAPRVPASSATRRARTLLME